jgi:hypothetical protein
MSTPRPEKATEIKNRSISLNPLTFDQAVDKLLAHQASARETIGQEAHEEGQEAQQVGSGSRWPVVSIRKPPTTPSG